MKTNRSENTIILKDGRNLGYAEYGSSDGTPVFYFHGFPGSRLDWQFSDATNLAATLGARVIAVDRPGMGLSDFQKKREILDWPDDVSQLADALQIDSFAVVGISGGGPYAAACAYKIPDRLTHIAIVSGMGPSHAPGMRRGTAWTIPGNPSFMRKILLKLFETGLQKNPAQFVARSKEQFPEQDRQLLTRPEMEDMYISMLREAFRSGTKGVNHEAGLYSRPWNFKPEEIVPVVHLWHGEQDKNVPVSAGHYMAEAIPNCQSVFLKDEAHLSLPYNHIEQILKVLVS